MKKQYDLMIIGPASRDENIDYTKAVDRSIGGAVTFCSASAYTANPSVFAAVVAAKGEDDVMDSIILPDDDKTLLVSPVTTSIRNEYFTADRERRTSRCVAQSITVTPEMIPAAECKMYHLAGLLYGDFSNELIVNLAGKGQLAGDAQGFLRHNENGEMVFHDWEDKKAMLPYFSFLKTDAFESLTLTGCQDRAEAAKQYTQGLGEIGVRVGVDGQHASVPREALDQHAGDEGLPHPTLPRQCDGQPLGAHLRLPSRTLSISSSIRLSCES